MHAEELIKRLKLLQSDTEREKYRRYFEFGEGTGDEFMGVRMGQVFALAKEFKNMPVSEIEKLLESPIHEVRTGAVSIMDFQARDKKTPESHRKEIFDLYLRRHDRINNWDLVDRAAPHVVGGYLYGKPCEVLYQLARSENVWERRTAIVSTAFFIRNKDLDDTYRIAEILVNDPAETVQKAVGWMLRTAGAVDCPRLRAFLDRFAATMPRIMLRNALEHFDKEERAFYLNMEKREK